VPFFVVALGTALVSVVRELIDTDRDETALARRPTLRTQRNRMFKMKAEKKSMSKGLHYAFDEVNESDDIFIHVHPIIYKFYIVNN
jgi:hypothetical protein